MRSIFGKLISGALVILLTGCNALTDYRFYHEGIGSDLYGYGSEAAATTGYLESYIGLLCVQAGLPRVMHADGTSSCSISETSSSDWSLIVQAGMNDIDGRCDAYITWLDDKRRSNEPFLKQLAMTGAATLGILDATSASVKAITITGIAFGLAANTFTNINARILSLEQSTVQSVVLDTQQKFRQNNNPSSVSSRPAAIYYLRNYLRICLPFSIETSVNNTVTVFHRAGSGALDDDTLFSKQVVITDPRKPFETPKPRPPTKSGTRLSLAEERLLPGEIARIQTALCIRAPDSDLGPQGSSTRRAIAGYFSGANGQPEAASVVLDQTKVATLLGAAGEVKQCPATFRSGYEVGAFASPASERANNVKEIQQKFIDIGSPGVTLSGTFDPATRTAIEKLRTDNAIAGSDGIINFPLHKRILGLKKPQ